MLRVMQKMLSLQAAVPRPRYLSCLPHYSSTDRDARGRPPTNNSSKWKSNLLLGTAAAAVTFATLTRVMSFLSVYSDGYSDGHLRYRKCQKFCCNHIIKAYYRVLVP